MCCYIIKFLTCRFRSAPVVPAAVPLAAVRYGGKTPRARTLTSFPVWLVRSGSVVVPSKLPTLVSSRSERVRGLNSVEKSPSLSFGSFYRFAHP